MDEKIPYKNFNYYSYINHFENRIISQDLTKTICTWLRLDSASLPNQPIVFLPHFPPLCAPTTYQPRRGEANMFANMLTATHTDSQASVTHSEESAIRPLLSSYILIVVRLAGETANVVAPTKILPQLIFNNRKNLLQQQYSPMMRSDAKTCPCASCKLYI